MSEVANEMTPFLDGGLRWVYGDDPPPLCSSCGFDWTITPADALAVIASSPERFEAARAGRDGMAEPADGGGKDCKLRSVLDITLQRALIQKT